MAESLAFVRIPSLKTVDACMENVADQLQGSGVRLGMAVMTGPDEREKYLDMGITFFQEAPQL